MKVLLSIDTVRALAFIAATASLTGPAWAGGEKFHCEIKKDDGTTADDSGAENRKACRDKGGKWIKAHQHDHASGADGHKHEKEAKKTA